MKMLEEILNGRWGEPFSIGDSIAYAQAESLERIADALESLVSDVSLTEFDPKSPRRETDE